MKDEKGRGREAYFVNFAVLISFFLRLEHFFSNSLHPDEALFATWGRVIASGRDPFLIGVLVDKPPLLFYLQAISLGLLGQDQVFAVRVPNLVAGILLIPITFSIVRDMCGGGTIGEQSFQKTAVLPPIISPFLVAILPMVVYFSASGFTDMLMLTLVAGAVLAMLRERSGWAGIWMGLALWAKLTAVLLLPLVVLVGMQGRGRELVGEGRLMQQLTRKDQTLLQLPHSEFWKGLGWLFGLLIIWLGVTQGFMEWLGTGDGQLVGGIRPISASELLPRLQEMWGYISPLFGVVVLIFGVLLLYYRSGWGWILLLVMVGYFGFHWVLATVVYDRYMLPLVWVGVLVVGVGLGEWGERLAAKARRREGRRAWSWGWVMVGVLVLVAFLGWGREEVEGEKESGVVVAKEVFGGMPYGTVVYDHWYSWQLRYYLFESKVFVNWVADPEQLVEDLGEFYDEGRFIVLPDDGRAEPFVRALRGAGYRLEKQLQSGEINYYWIVRVEEEE